MSPETILKICYDRFPAGSLMIQARELAMQERLDNRPILTPLPPSSGGSVGPESAGARSIAPSPSEIALETRTMWQPGRVLRVRFLDGLAEVQAKVAAVAATWEKYANIHFDFNNDPQAEIRISFTHDRGSWSYLGTDALAIPADQPTMNYGWLTPTTPDADSQRGGLHDFGHALGCIHEHQNPTVNIPWNKPAVYAAYAGPPNYRSQVQVDTNLFTRYAREATQFSQFDKASIMLYAIPRNLTDGVFEVGWNRALSATDKTFISKMYPGRVPEVVELQVGAAPTAADIGTHGEEDQFCFRVTEPGIYCIETGGRTDVRMGLFGPDNPARQIGHDDDSGQSLNARIQMSLVAGEYIARVRHFRPRGRGQYTVWVRKV